MKWPWPVAPDAAALKRHAEAHPCPDAGAHVVPCVCGDSRLIVCDACGAPLFLATRTFCRHARALWEDRGI